MLSVPEVGVTKFRKFDQAGVEYIGVVTWVKLYRDSAGEVNHWQALVAQPSGAEYVNSSDPFRSSALWHPVDYIHEVGRNRVAPPPVVAEDEAPAEAPAPVTGRRKAA